MNVHVKLGAVFEYLRGSLWFGPTVAVVAALIVGNVLTGVAVGEGSVLDPVVFRGGAEGARAILQSVATSVITVTALVFSLTVVTLQLASSQFSPRLLRTFLRDGRNQVVLGIFLATFTYSLVVLRGVRSGTSPEGDVVPGLALSVLFVLVLASIGAFVTFINYIAQSVRIDSLMRDVEHTTQAAIDAVYPLPHCARPAPALPEPPFGAVDVPAAGSGFVTAIDSDLLLRVAIRHQVKLRLVASVGDRVVDGHPLAVAWAGRRGEQPSLEASLAKAVNKAVKVGFERTMQQDVGYGLRQLVDVAVRALSQGVNDPTTAVHAIGHLSSLLCRLAGRDLVHEMREDEAGTVLVAVPWTDLGGYLDLVCRQIRLYGAGDPLVAIELLRLLREVVATPGGVQQLPAVMHQARLIVKAAERGLAEGADVEAVRQAAEAIGAPSPATSA